MGYLEYLPASYGGADPSPLLVFLHGSGEAGDGSSQALELVDDLGVPQLIADGDWPADRPFVVLSPQYATRYAEGECGFGDDLAAFLEFALDHYDVDPARVYLTGVSCGAIGMWDYFASHGDEAVAAAVPISGHAMWAFEKAGCGLTHVPPLWVLHGAEDEIVPARFVEQQVDDIRACEGGESVSIELTVLAGADHVGAITETYDLSGGHDIYAWLLDHSLD
jgi:predicted peptidase